MKISQHNVFCNPLFTNLIDIENIDYILELGAYDGNYTKEINWLYKPKKIYSIEANPLQIDKIKINQSMLTNVELFNVALWSEETTLSFNVFDDFGDFGSSSFYEHPTLKSKKIEVKTKTLDSFVKENNISRIDIILADVEGAESNIFKNQEFLKKVKYIICEAKLDTEWKGKHFPNINNIKESLEPLGFIIIKEIYCTPQSGELLWKNINL